MIEISTTQNWNIGDKILFLFHGNLRTWIVVGFNEDKTSFVLQDPWFMEYNMV